MYKNRKIKWVLSILVVIMVILSFKFISVNYKFIVHKNQVVFKVAKSKSAKNVKKYGYGDILECLQKNKNFVVKSINVMENEICNVEVNYSGDIKLLYSSLCYLNESENFLNINKISIDKDAKITSVGINFKKNK